MTTIEFDAAEWEPLIRRQVRGYCRAPLPAHVSQDDLVQDVLVSVWRSLPRYPGTREDLPKWITHIAKCRVADAYRAAARKPSTPIADPDYLDYLLPTGGDEVEGAALSRDLTTLLAPVSPNHRQILALRALGRSNHEIAAALGRTVGAVKTAASRGRQQMRGHNPYTSSPRKTLPVEVADIRWPLHYVDQDLGDLDFLVEQLRARRPIPPTVLRLVRGVPTVADWPSARRLAAAHLAGVTRVRAVWAPLPQFPLATVDPAWRPRRATA
ncbi:RNA polymerase sigma factor [Saccharothrix sp. HUAS TT1]|uniref:RNA polymerase sigma factor n=1 Tax=unclassified Saccharothrix TaxID=2593673 RepID=UPI00345B5485